MTTKDDEKEGELDRMAQNCSHLDQIREVTPSANGCEDWAWCYIDEMVLKPA